MGLLRLLGLLSLAVSLLAGCSDDRPSTTTQKSDLSDWLTGDVITGRVVLIKDGDTLVLLVDQKKVTIRLAWIDTPERGQPGGAKSKKALAALVGAQLVRVVVVRTGRPAGADRYGRTVGLVYVGDTDVNRTLVREGHAWVSPRYNHDPDYLQAEEDARGALRGLWSLPPEQRIPPWQWRKKRRHSRVYWDGSRSPIITLVVIHRLSTSVSPVRVHNLFLIDSERSSVL